IGLGHFARNNAVRGEERHILEALSETFHDLKDGRRITRRGDLRDVALIDLPFPATGGHHQTQENCCNTTRTPHPLSAIYCTRIHSVRSTSGDGSVVRPIRFLHCLDRSVITESTSEPRATR